MFARIFFTALVLFCFLFICMAGEYFADVSADLEQAEILKDNRKYEQAEAIYQQIVTAFPDTNDALEVQKQLILFYIDTDSLQEANAAYQQLLADFSGHKDLPKTVYDIAYRYHDINRDDKALELHQYNAEHHPDDKYAMWSQVEITYYYIIDGNDTTADTALDALLTVFSEQDTLSKEICQVAVMYSKFQRFDKSLALHQYNLEHFPESRYAMWSQIEIVHSYIRDGNEPEADAAFEKLVSIYSQQPSLPLEVYQIAEEYARRERYDKANQLHQYVIDIWSGSENSMWAKASTVMSNISLGNEAAADEETLDNLITDFNDHPELPTAVFMIGEEYYYKAFEDRKEELDEQAQEHFRKAAAIWERILTDLPVSFEHTPHACYCLAVVYSQELAKYATGIEYFQEIVNYWPDYQYAWNAQFFIGNYYEKLRDSGYVSESEANPLIEQAYQAVVENYTASESAPVAALKLGDIYFNKRRWIDAAYYYELFVQLNNSRLPNHVLASGLYHLGRAYEQMDQLDLAMETYGILIETDPNNPRIEFVKARLEKLEGATK